MARVIDNLHTHREEIQRCVWMAKNLLRPQLKCYKKVLDSNLWTRHEILGDETFKKQSHAIKLVLNATLIAS
jgi:hypothetical protein